MTSTSGVDIDVTGLTVRAGAVEILRDVTFRISAGEHVAIMGPSGSGKSTLLRALAGLLEPTAGRIASGSATWSDGGRIVVPPERRGIGMIAQDLALWPHLTAREHVLATLRWRGFALDGRDAESDRLLTWVGLGERTHHRPSQLSGGEAQRLALVRAIAGGTRLLLLDEPFTALDLPLRRELGRESSAIARERGATVLHVTHDPLDAERLAQRVLVLERGAAVQFDTVAALRARPSNGFVAALFCA